MKIPENHNWKQTNEGDIFGVVHSCTNMNFDRAGKVSLNKKPFKLYGSTDDADFGYLLNINYFDDQYVFLTDDEIFSGNLTAGNSISEEAAAASVTLVSDSVVWNSLYNVTTNTSLETWTGTTWTDRSLSLTGGVPHPLEVFESLAEYQLAVGNGNSVYLYNTSYSKSSTQLNLSSEFQVTSLRYRNGYLYVGTKNLNGGSAKIFIWNGSGNAAQYECVVGAAWVYSMTPYGTTVAAITSSGQLIEIVGSSYTQLSALPVYYLPDVKWQGSSGLSNNGKVFNRGMITVGERIFLNIDGDTDNGFIPTMPSGLWVYDPQVGLHHRSSLSTEKYVSDSSFTFSSNEITTSADHSLKTGDAIVFNAQATLTGIDDDTLYYVTVTDTDKFKLSRSHKALANSIYIDLSGSITTEELIYMPNTDIGDTFNNTSGAVALPVFDSSTEEPWKTEVIFGGRVRTDDDTAEYVLNLFTPSFQVGRFELQRIYSEDIEDTYNKLFSYIDGLKLSNEQYIIKSRVDSKEETPIITGEWISNNQIRSTLASRGTSPWEDLEEGFEIIITDGFGRGYSAHITEIESSAKTYTITIDETFGNSGDSAEFYATNYKKSGDYGAQSESKEAGASVKSNIDRSAGWIQFKCEVRGFETQVAINELEKQRHE